MWAEATNNQNQRIAVFPGTFDPFTVGHHSIVRRGLHLFDKIIIAIGVNIHKPDARQQAERRLEVISRLYDGTPRVSVMIWEGLTADLARKQGAKFILRGVRSVADFEYERNMAEVNNMIGQLETVILFAEPGLGSVSSSMVRELKAFGHDVTPFLPKSTNSL